jgi:purine-nucleoside phosphorylase
LNERLAGRFQPSIGLVLGSGLGGLAREIASKNAADRAIILPYSELGFPAPKVAGHAGDLVVARVGDKDIACLSGRIHMYEGHALDEIVFAVRCLARAGCSTFILTNAAGGINANLHPGDLMLLSDHLNLTGKNPLIGPFDHGHRFIDMSTAYDTDLRALARAIGERHGIHLHEGVYAALLGPSYETPAEIRMLRTLGADAVGMSTVPEVIALRELGVRCLVVSTITNYAAGLSSRALDHGDVQQVGKQATASLTKLLMAILTEM